MKDLFKNKALGFYMGLAAAAIAVIGSVLYLALDVSDRTFTWLSFCLMLAGGLVWIACFIVLPILKLDEKLPWVEILAPLVCTLLYVMGFAFTLNAALPSLSDVWNNVNFIGGNAAMGVAFSAVFLVAAVAGIVECFLAHSKKPSASVKEEA